MLNPSRSIRFGLAGIMLGALVLGLSTNVVGFWGLLLALAVAAYLALVVLMLPQPAGDGAMRRVFLAAFVALAASLVVAPLIGGAADRQATETIRLFSRETGETKIDLGRHGTSPGDLEIATDRLYHANGRGAPIGRDEATFTSFTADVSDVSGSFTLPQGTIVVGGSVRFGAPIVVAVLGGTGAYSSARGTLELRGQGEHAAHLVFLLSAS
jgi:hypothetical protein